MLKPTLFAATLTLLISVAFLQAQTTKPDITLPPNVVGGDYSGSADIVKKSPRHGEWVDVDVPGSTTKVKTFVVYPERPDKAPVIVVIHEIYGMTPWVQAVADRLAAEGFIAAAPDLLSGMGPNGGGTESLGNNVGQTIAKLTDDEKVKRLDAVRAYALALPSATKMNACIGFCWGGTASFMYASRQPGLNAAVVFYGSAPKDNAALAKITCPVLGNYGGNDARITMTVAPTKAAMADLKKNYFPNIYDGTGHGFMRQQSASTATPGNPAAALQGWTKTIEFFKKNLEVKP
jgi:carboxymethylenebutenolidase